MFRVGQKVICIRGAGGRVMRASGWVIIPKEGTVYTVRGIARSDKDPNVPTIVLAEIRNPLHACGEEYDWSADRFRPVVERKTDISVFTEMLKTQPTRLRELISEDGREGVSQEST